MPTVHPVDEHVSAKAQYELRNLFACDSMGAQHVGLTYREEHQHQANRLLLVSEQLRTASAACMQRKMPWIMSLIQLAPPCNFVCSFSAFLILQPSAALNQSNVQISR